MKIQFRLDFSKLHKEYIRNQSSVYAHKLVDSSTMMAPDEHVKSAQMAAHPGFCLTKGRPRAGLNEIDAKEAQRTGQVDGMVNDPITLIMEDRAHYRDIPVNQSLEDWNDFWFEYKSS